VVSRVKRDLACAFTRHLPCARCPAVAVMLGAGGAGTYTQRAIPGAGPSLGSCAFCPATWAFYSVDTCAAPLVQTDCGLQGGQDQMRQLGGQVILMQGTGEPFAALR
jgi:hypothetical protein